MLWFSSELKSGERMLMICRENEARPDESPAKVFITQRNLERDGGEGEGVRMEKWRGWAGVKVTRMEQKLEKTQVRVGTCKIY